VSDSRPSDITFQTGWKASIGGYAAWILARKSEVSEIARTAFIQAVPSLPQREIRNLLKALIHDPTAREIRAILKKAL
jgi:hypothetical protein